MRTSYAMGSRTGVQALTLTALNMKGPIYMNFNDIYDTRYLRRTGVGYVIRPHAPFADWISMAGVALIYGEIEVGAGRTLLIHNAAGLYIPDTRNYQANVIVAGLRADSTNTLRGSGILTLRGAYWDSVAGTSKDRDAQIIHRMLSTTPTSEIAFQIAGSDKLCIGDTYVDAKGLLFKNARLPCASKGLTAVTVTETSVTLKQSVAPDSGFYGFAYIEGIRVTASNPTGSGVTLYFQVKALLDDGTEVNLSDVKSVAEGGSFDDWLRWIYDSVGNGRTIREVRLYAYCSATPATGYEPTVNLAKVTGVQV
jgi:hypothetical protein